MTRAPMGTHRRIIRAPNHLGDVVMALPAMAADGADVLVVRWLAPLVQMAELPGQVLPFDRGLRGWGRAVRSLRRGGYGEATLLAPSFSSAHRRPAMTPSTISSMYV